MRFKCAHGHENSADRLPDRCPVCGSTLLRALSGTAVAPVKQSSASPVITPPVPTVAVQPTPAQPSLEHPASAPAAPVQLAPACLNPIGWQPIAGVLGLVVVLGLALIMLCKSDRENQTLVFAAVLWYYTSLCFWLIARKTRTGSPWMAWIPIVNGFLLCKIGGKSSWWVLWCFIPGVGIIFTLLLLWQIPKALGVTSFAKWLIILPVLNFFYLGYLAFRTETSPALSPL